MRYLLILLAMCCCSPTFAQEASQDKKESVTFNGKTLVLASEGKNPGETFKEYIPADQKLESWTELASVRLYAELDDPLAVGKSLVQQLKKQNPQAQSKIIHNEKTGEVIVDFVTWPPDVSLVEFNIFKYSKNKKGGLTAHQYALREYDDQIQFLKDLKPLRKKLVKLMIDEGLEMDSPQDQKAAAEAPSAEESKAEAVEDE